MKCITFGQLIAIVIILSILFGTVGVPDMAARLVTSGVIIYWIAGLVLDCSNYN